MTETVMLEIPLSVYTALQNLARTKHSDPVTVLEEMLDVSQDHSDQALNVMPQTPLQELLLQGPTITDEEVAEYERIREWMNEWTIPRF